MRLFQETLNNTTYYHKLIPYLSQMNDEQILQLEFHHFKGLGEIDTIFRTFHKRHIATLKDIDNRLSELQNSTITEQLRRGTSFQQVLDELRQVPRKPQ